jgi:hypothetical protein
MKSGEKINDCGIATENYRRMRLWTWQNPNFVITDPNMPVESKTYSKCLNVNRPSGKANKHLKEYEKLWSILGTDQFHWYFTDREEATSNISMTVYKGAFLWEIEVPENLVFKRICGMAWHLILDDSNPWPGTTFENLYIYLLNILSFKYSRNAFAEEFSRPWQDMKKRQQLWDCLFAECGVRQCYDVLVRHPVDASWVVKDPRNEGDKSQTRN